MNKLHRNNLLALLLIALCIVGIFWGYLRHKALTKNHKIGVARITSFSSGGTGNAGGIWIDYLLTLNEKEYKGSSLYSLSDFSVPDIKKYFLHKTFPAVYNQDNPKISSIMITPKDFKRYGYSFPDSLNWVLQYFKK